MHQHGHWGAALLAYSPLAFLAVAIGAGEIALLGGGVAVTSAMVPDLDQRIPGLEHRGLTHTVWFALGYGVLTGIAGGLLGSRAGPLEAVALGIFGYGVGAVTVASHVAADALTPAGVQPFAPRSLRWYSYDVATSRNPLANLSLFGLGIAAAVIALAGGQEVHVLLPV